MRPDKLLKLSLETVHEPLFPVQEDAVDRPFRKTMSGCSDWLLVQEEMRLDGWTVQTQYVVRQAEAIEHVQMIHRVHIDQEGLLLMCVGVEQQSARRIDVGAVSAGHRQHQQMKRNGRTD